MSAAIEVRGLREVTSAFRKVDKDIPKGLRAQFLPIAQRVASGAASKANADFKNPTGKAVGSIRPRASQRGAAIAFGGTAAPYFPWLDFGGSTGKGHRPGASWSGSVKRDWMGRPVGEGRYIYPAISEQSDEIEKAAEDAVLNVAKAAQLEVK